MRRLLGERIRQACGKEYGIIIAKRERAHEDYKRERRRLHRFICINNAKLERGGRYDTTIMLYLLWVYIYINIISWR